MESYNKSEIKIVTKEIINKRKIQVGIEGSFGSGQYTLLGALLKSKINFLPSYIFIPNIIIKIVFSNDNEKAVIYYKCKTQEHKEVEIISFEELADKIRTERLKELDVRYIEFTLPELVFENNIEIILIPLMYNTLNFEIEQLKNNCDVIIHVFDILHAFMTNERDWFKVQFENKQLKNVFFVGTKYDVVKLSQQEELKDYTLSVLYNIFIDKNGKFDNHLYEQRVFLVNAFGSLCIRTGEPYEIVIGKKRIEVPLTDDETGVPKFEKALMDFIEWEI